MSLAEARAYRQMPFLKRGMRANMDGHDGVITSGDGTHLRMRYSGEKRARVVHPWWQMTYYAQDGSVIKDYKQKESKEA